MAKKQEPASLKSLDSAKEMKLLGARIKAIRKKKGYSSAERFANEHDIHRVQWGRYEAGQDLYVSTLFKVIQVLNVSVDEFFSEGF
jgi:transcriptional regulator with XRE-family HTH domain